MSTDPTPAPRPSSPRRKRVALAVIAVVLAVAVVGVLVWWKKRPAELPAPGSAAYEEYVEAFDLALAAMDSGVGDVAEKNLNRLVELVPGEPAGWANRGLYYLRSRQFPRAAADLAQAEKLAPDHPAVQTYLALLDERQGKFTEAAARFRRVVEKDPRDIETLYTLAKIIDKEQQAGADAEYQRLMEQILAVRPGNLRVLGERLRVAVRRADRPAVNDTVARLRSLSVGWTDQTRTQFAELEKSLAGELGGENVPMLVFLNVVKVEPVYPHDADEVNPADGEVGRPVRVFVKLAPARNSPAAPDTGLTFTPEPLAAAPPGKWDVAAAAWLTADGPPVVVVANAKEMRVGNGAAVQSIPLSPQGVVAFDWNNDFHADILVVGPSGMRFYDKGTTDVTAKTKLPPDVLNVDIAAALAADVDLDGDLDVIACRRTGSPVFLRNNFDGTFTARPIFEGVEDVRVIAWGDFDDDGAADVAMIDSRAKLRIYANERSGAFKWWPAKPPEDRFLALTVTDANDDGVLDVVALREDGAIVGVCGKDKRAKWDVIELARWTPQNVEPGTVRLYAADLDNNGVPDLLASGASGGAAWLGSGNGKFEPLAATIPARVFAAVDSRGTGRLDLLALDADGRPVTYKNAGTKNYHWQSVRFRSMPPQQLEGDNRINSFGVGGEIEVRTGTHVVKRPIAGPVVHIGLGERTRATVVRIRWANGIVQSEFSPAIDQVFAPPQRLKGSCPFLFTWNGTGFVFVTDFMWGTPLGLYINAQARGGFLQSMEWVRIRGDQLVPRDGLYEVRAQANLWETHYFDHLALHVVDHPPGTEMFVDERFALGPSTPTFQLMETPRPVMRAKDHRGDDVTEIVRDVDAKYLDRCGRGLFQGIANDHWVEVELGDEAPQSGPVWLVAHGWIHPTDSSINYSLEQGTNTKPRALVLEVPDGKGGWKVARDGIGFPAGKNKTVLLRLDGLDGPGVCRRFRIRTNLEIFWDALHVATGRDNAEVRKTELLPATADLRYRGILEMTQANASSPELPHYDRVLSTRQEWRDLIGYHTRFGDVKELLDKIDDRYAILNAGDEIALTFPAPPGPPPGWKRSFIWVSDGWEKDGDLNTKFGKTVLPLPYHGMTAYETPPGRLQDDPVFKRFPKDWDVFHTRHVRPAGFERGLRPRP
jgi:hypothetical protein